MENNSLKSKVLYGLIWKFGERISAQVISLVVSIVLARLLSPADYGAVTMVLVFITIANVFVSSGFGNALIQKKDADDLDFSSVFYFNILLGIILYIILFLAAPYIAVFYHMPILTKVLRVLGIRIIVASINSVQQAYVSRNMLFKRFFWSTLFGTVVSGIVGIILAYRGYGVWALVVQYLTNTCTDTLVLWFTVCWRPKLMCSWKRAKLLLAYGWKLLASALLDTGYRQLRSLIIGRKYTSEDLAYYNQGDKYPNLVVANVDSSISSVLFPALAIYQDDRKKIKEMTKRAIQICSYILWPLLIGFGVVADSFVKIILTDKWMPCVPYIRIFCFTYGLWPIHTSNLQALKALGRSDLFLKLESIKKIIGIVSIVIAMKYGPLVMAYSLVVTDLLSMYVNAAPNKKMINYPFGEQIKDMMPGFVLSLIMALIIYPLKFIHIPSICILVIQILLGGGIYIGLSYITKQQALLYIWKIIRKK
ncbi:lipopolysaccharide biosynthesis protein [Kineothrix sp. MSJ-39]|uniref:lipopolysaccharide biosynthesis protein n=1 Tax=Kineothrix sp. MSJ-39 TaxID=2841533 RepID=UPI001C0F7546|nr:lipopolysaccharide biosynthesis protein [Kineothrix sp. MSJ-39]MBU5428780.1 lipopolysaccharide biosynthesis protein [Kineothrix sp. MSJ-39]